MRSWSYVCWGPAFPCPPSAHAPGLPPQECYLDSDQTGLYHAAKGLMTLQALYGTIPQIFGKGECARVSPARPPRLRQGHTATRPRLPPWSMVVLPLSLLGVGLGLSGARGALLAVFGVGTGPGPARQAPARCTVPRLLALSLRLDCHGGFVLALPSA